MSATQIHLGETVLEAVVPDDLNDRLLGMVGVSAAEMHRLLEHPCVASTVAAALIPLLAEPPSRGALASQIAEHGANVVRRKLHRLYGGALRRKRKKGGANAQAQA